MNNTVSTIIHNNQLYGLFTRSCKSIRLLIVVGMVSFLIAGCTAQETEPPSPGNISEESFGTLQDGSEARLFTLTNSNDIKIQITNYGGIITTIRTPDKDGNIENVVLGFDSVDKYEGDHPYFGATVGRYANRIAGATFEIDGTEYNLPANDGNNHLHGGVNGFHRVLFDAEVTDEDQLILSYLSEDGEEGYPGNLDVQVLFTLSDDNELTIEYRAETDKSTPVNLTNHSYFNLSGDPSVSVLNHELTLNASYYTPVDEELIPTGEISPVDGTPFDFRQPKIIGDDIDEVEGGYDHNYVISELPSDTLQEAGTLYSPESGREMKVFTMEPGIQFYSGNFLDGSLSSPSGTPFEQHSGLCLETQHFPNSPNEPAFPSTILEPDDYYHTVTVYRFGTR